LSYERYRRSRNRLAFVSVLEGTYRGTLDCPELNGVRDGQQSLKNHEAGGEFTPDMWRLYRRAGIDVGVLLMVDRPDQQAWEVLYVGVIESARGSGVGRAMLLDALDAARAAGVERLLIVADVRNIPAVSLYESLGFQPVASRVACVRLAPSLPRDRPHDASCQQ
jgi:ribosomal protein S18 acetylase RimI-like enzyme